MIILYAQWPIIEKHARYALYHPSAEAFASMITDIPYKIVNSFCFNLVLYFMASLRREPGPFFFFILVSFIVTLVMSMMFRTDRFRDPYVGAGSSAFCTYNYSSCYLYWIRNPDYIYGRLGTLD